MKKIACLLALILALSCVFGAALAADEKTSVLLTGYGKTIDEYVSTDTNRVEAVVLAILDAGMVLDVDASTIDISKPAYIGKTPSGIGLDVFFGRSGGGYYDVVWYDFDDSIYLYQFSYNTLEQIQAANPEVTYYTVESAALVTMFQSLANN